MPTLPRNASIQAMGKSHRKSDGQYLPLPYSFLKSDAWRSLSGAAVKLYLELHTKFNGGNNGKLILSFSEAGEVLGMGKATVQRAYSELTKKGFVVLEREGNWYQRRAHEWRLTSKPMQTPKGKLPPTNDWRKFRKPKKNSGPSSEPSDHALGSFENL